MSRTTIEVSESTRDMLREARTDAEQSYDDTIVRLLGEAPNGRLWTEAEIRGIVQEEVTDRVRMEALE